MSVNFKNNSLVILLVTCLIVASLVSTGKGNLGSYEGGGNSGTGNLGKGNSGSNNVGDGNSGSRNVGNGNSMSDNIGNSNQPARNQGR